MPRGRASGSQSGKDECQNEWLTRVAGWTKLQSWNMYGSSIAIRLDLSRSHINPTQLG